MVTKVSILIMRSNHIIPDIRIRLKTRNHRVKNCGQPDASIGILAVYRRNLENSAKNGLFKKKENGGIGSLPPFVRYYQGLIYDMNRPLIGV